MEFITIDPTTIVAQLLNLLILFLIIRYFLFKPVKKILDDRKAEVESAYEQAEKARADAQRLEEEYEGKMAQAKSEAAEIMKSATKRAALRSEEILHDAQTQAGNLLEKANAQIDSEKKKAVNEAKDQIASIALLAATKVVGRDMTAADHEKLIEDFIDSDIR